MIDWILAQAQTLDTTAIASWAGGAGITGTVAIYFFKKITNHVDDESKHIPANSVIVTEKDCEASQKNFTTVITGIKEDTKENKDAVKVVHQRLDDMIILLSEYQSTILTAIAKIKE